MFWGMWYAWSLPGDQEAMPWCSAPNYSEGHCGIWSTLVAYAKGTKAWLVLRINLLIGGVCIYKRKQIVVFTTLSFQGLVCFTAITRLCTKHAFAFQFLTTGVASQPPLSFINYVAFSLMLSYCIYIYNNNNKYYISYEVWVATMKQHQGKGS